MPVQTNKNSRFTVDLDNQPAAFNRMMVELSDGAGTGGSATDKNTEIEEENKASQAESDNNDNELFKHLSYLS